MITTQSPRVPTLDEIVQKARALRPLLESNAARAEDERRVPDENMQAIVDAGLTRIAVPKRYGGYETNVRTITEVAGALAEGCSSTGWISTLINTSSWMIGMYPLQAQDEIFGADPDTRSAGVFAANGTSRRVDGGWIVSGKWGYASGIGHATWAGFGFLMTDEKGEVYDQGYGLAPIEDVAIEDTWFVAGLKGTGSNTIVVDALFVPEHRVLGLSGVSNGIFDHAVPGEVLYRSSAMPTLNLVLVGALPGMARAALRYVTERAGRKSVPYSIYERQADSAVIHAAIGQAALKISDAELHMRRAATEIDDAAQRDEQLDMMARTRVRAEAGHVARLCIEAVDILMTCHGSGGFADVSALQRIWRDINIGARHGAVNHMIGDEAYGKALLGVGPQISTLI